MGNGEERSVKGRPDVWPVGGHYRFRGILKAKGEQMGTRVIVGTEEYTSKTCTNCLHAKSSLPLTERQERQSC